MAGTSSLLAGNCLLKVCTFVLKLRNGPTLANMINLFIVGGIRMMNVLRTALKRVLLKMPFSRVSANKIFSGLGQESLWSTRKHFPVWQQIV